LTKKAEKDEKDGADKIMKDILDAAGKNKIAIQKDAITAAQKNITKPLSNPDKRLNETSPKESK